MKKSVLTSLMFLVMTLGIKAANVTIDATLATTIQNSLNAGTSYTLETTGNITVAANISKTSGTGATLTLKATGKITVNANCPITSTSNALNIVFWSDSDATYDGLISLLWTTTITTNGGHLWIGGGSGTTTWNGLSVGNGYAEYDSGAAVLLNGATISTSGGDIQIKGESIATVQNSMGIWMNLGGLNAGSGNISLFGIGGLYTGTQANCDGIQVGGPITTTTGNISLTGSSTAQQNTEGIAIESSNIASTSGNISLIADIFFIQTSPRISSSGTLTLKPLTDGSTIGIAGGAGTMILPATYFTTNFVDGFSGITIGSGTSGNIGIKAIPFNDPVTFNANGNLNLENDINLNGQTINLGNEIALNETAGKFSGTSGSIKTTRTLSDISAVNVAGLGATLTTTADMGATTITRSHTNQIWGEKNSVLRYFDIAPTNNTSLNATMVFNYNDAELNGLTESKLLLYKSTNSGTTYSCEGGTVNTTANTITLAGIGDFSRWMAAEIWTLTWNGAGSDFNTAANWTPNITPTTLYNLTIPDLATDPIVNQAPATPAVCNDLAIASGAVLTIAPGKSLTVNGTLTNSAGNTGLVIKSDATGTGSLIHSTANIGATAQRYIAGWGEVANHGWHFLSSPVANQAISSTFVDVTLIPMSTNVDLYKWSEPENLWINIKNGSMVYNQGSSATNWSNDASPLFETGKGYLTAYGSDQTKEFIGNLNVANVSLTGLTSTAGKTYRGWHLVGNPFSSAIKWTQGTWVKTNITAVPQIWNETNASYKVLKGDGIIPAQNGFMVFVTEGLTGSLTIPADARLHSDSAWYKNSASTNEIVLIARDPEGQTAQETIISFNSEATEDFDMAHDSYFMAGFAPMFYSISQNKHFALNTLPEFSEETVIPFNFIKNEGTNFTIEATGIETLEPAATVYLKDNKLGINHNLSENPVYTFTSTTGDAPARFELCFGSVGISETPVTQTIQAWYYEGTLTVKTTETLTAIDIFNVQGQNLQNFQLYGSGLQTLQLNLAAGVYFARLVNDGNMKTLKMIVR